MIFNTIQIGNNTLYRPNGFSPKREYIYAGEITTCTGKTIADLVGWKYADMQLQWDAIPQAQLDVLLAMNGHETTLTFTDATGQQVTENIIPLTHSMTATRSIKNGVPVWSDIQTEVRFTNAHN